jgi:mannose-6-phosphate isomerase
MEPLAAFARRPVPLPLECGVQHYDWGQRGPRAYIPRLLAVDAADRPWAELWIGAHPVRPAQAWLEGASIPLGTLIESAPAAAVGEATLRRFGPRLPFLLKVLAAERMLSIQAHPNRDQARAGFAGENERQVPLEAPHRNYRDDSHKPELIVALTDFFALCGFRPEAEIAQVFSEHAELQPLLVEAGGSSHLARLFQACLSMPQPRADDVLGRLVARLALHRAGYGPDRHERWLLQADEQFSRNGHRDRGLLVMLLLNLIRLAPGQALYLGAGVPHAYLEGVGVELMASSDNVLRGGLTSKHVDVAELQKILVFRGGRVVPLEPDAGGTYHTRAEEFELTRFDLGPGATRRLPAGPWLLLGLDGDAIVRTPVGDTELPRGASAFIPAALAAEVTARGTAARLFGASIPAVRD